MIILDYFLFNEPQFSTALFTGLFLMLSGIIGFVLRRLWIEGATWGFLILAGSANLAIYISRSLELPTSGFGPLVLLICALLVMVLRYSFFTARPEAEPASKTFVVVVVALGVVIWSGNILHPFPDSGFSSHHGWVPLYLQESYGAGQFLKIEDMAFGEGLMTTLYYPADLLGLVALAGWLGVEEVYPAFNAGSIATTLLMFSILSRTLRSHSIALMVFFVLTMIMFGFDPFFRTVLGGNWGDVLMYLGGALVCYYLCQHEGMVSALILAAAASTFLAFARHYGAFYSAFIIAFCFFVSWGLLRERSFKPWLIIGTLWAVASARELYYLIGRFTQYYPGSWQTERITNSAEVLFLGALTDWGLIDGSNFSLTGISIRSIYVAVLIISLLKISQQREEKRFQIAGILAPLVLLLAPLFLQTLTGYRTNQDYSKLYILSIFIFAWYPPYLLSHLQFDGSIRLFNQKARIPIYAAATITLVLLGGALFEKLKPGRFVGNGLEETLQLIFEDKIVDREIVAILQNDLSSNEMLMVVNTPILYLHYEPGTSLRLYLGGTFKNDLDFWSVPVGVQGRESKSFEELLERLGYPNVYIALMRNGKVSPFIENEMMRFFPEIEESENAPWVKKVIRYGEAQFFIVQNPLNEKLE
jgi:hypothetical protein